METTTLWWGMYLDYSRESGKYVIWGLHRDYVPLFPAKHQ